MTNIFSLITSGKDYITIVKEFIGKVFLHEEKKFKHHPGDIVIMITKTADGNLQIRTYSMTEKTVIRTIPDKEVQDILMK